MLFLLLFIRCNDDDSLYNITDCKSIICTDILVSLTLSLKHAADSSAYILSDYKVFRVSDGRDIKQNHDDFLTSRGYYPIANDSEIGLFKFKNVEVEFKGYLHNDLVIQRNFIITADCCHVSLVDGGNLSYFIKEVYIP
jgi:hypothetical protein